METGDRLNIAFVESTLNGSMLAEVDDLDSTVNENELRYFSIFNCSSICLLLKYSNSNNFTSNYQKLYSLFNACTWKWKPKREKLNFWCILWCGCYSEWRCQRHLWWFSRNNCRDQTILKQFNLKETISILKYVNRRQWFENFFQTFHFFLLENTIRFICVNNFLFSTKIQFYEERIK